jgi:peptidyl-prolyl cis-trans isomerase C
MESLEMLGHRVTAHSQPTTWALGRTKRSARSVALLLAGAGLSGLLSAACDLFRETPTETRDPITGLTTEEDREVLVRVGDKPITLGDYARTLARMDEFERLRYQTKERKAELLDELINAELLAQEAVRRGLDQDPEYQARLFLAMKDERLEELRRSLPPLESFSEAEVRDYYNAHASEYDEPERRRPLVIVLPSKQAGEEALKKAKGASGEVWGKLAREVSLDRRGLGEGDSLELAGDLGFVSQPGEARGANENVPEPVRAALFQLSKLGDVAPEPVSFDGKFYLVRHGGTSPARHRSVQDADRSIRIELRRQLFRKKEAELAKQLAEKYPATINREALEKLIPKAPASPEPTEPGPREKLSPKALEGAGPTEKKSSAPSGQKKP